MAEEAESKDSGSSNNKQISPMKLVIVMIIGSVLLVAVSIGGVFYMMKSMGMLDGAGGGGGGHGTKDVSQEPAIYFPLEPAFVVNFSDRGRTRFLQVTMEVMSRDPEVIENIKKHMPLIRNNLLLLLSNQKAEDLHSVEGKEKIRQAALEEMSRILAEEAGQAPNEDGKYDTNLEGLYFTSFVTQ